MSFYLRSILASVGTVVMLSLGSQALADDPISATVRGVFDIVGAVVNTADGLVTGTVDTAGNVINAAGKTVGYVAFDATSAVGRLTVDTAGNVVDTTGHVVGHVVRGATAATTGSVRVTIDASGNVIDATGKTVGRVLSNTTGAALTVTQATIDTAGNVVDANGRLIGRIVTAPHAAATDMAISPSVALTISTDVTGRTAKVNARINAELAAGRITVFQAEKLRAQLALIVDKEAKFVVDRKLSRREQRDLEARWNRVESKLNAAIARNQEYTM